jgi:hypothetical protein
MMPARAKTTFGKPYPMFEAMCLAHGIKKPDREVRFHEVRQWRFDFAWGQHYHEAFRRVALEVDGGVWTSGRHVRGKGFISDMEKMNEAQLAGWLVLRCTPQDIESGAVFELLKRALC